MYHVQHMTHKFHAHHMNHVQLAQWAQQLNKMQQLRHPHKQHVRHTHRTHMRSVRHEQRVHVHHVRHRLHRMAHSHRRRHLTNKRLMHRRYHRPLIKHTQLVPHTRSGHPKTILPSETTTATCATHVPHTTQAAQLRCTPHTASELPSTPAPPSPRASDTTKSPHPSHSLSTKLAMCDPRTTCTRQATPLGTQPTAHAPHPLSPDALQTIKTTTVTCTTHVVRATQASQPTHTPYSPSATRPIGTTLDPSATSALTPPHATPNTTPMITQTQVTLQYDNEQEKTPTRATSTLPPCPRGSTSTFLNQAKERTETIKAASDAITAQRMMEHARATMARSDAASEQLANALVPPGQDPAAWREKTLDEQRIILRDSLIRNKPTDLLTPPPKWGTPPHSSAGKEASLYGPKTPPSTSPDTQERTPREVTPPPQNKPWALKIIPPTEPLLTRPAPVLSFEETERQRSLALLGAQENTPTRPTPSALDLALAGANDLLTRRSLLPGPSCTHLTNTVIQSRRCRGGSRSLLPGPPSSHPTNTVIQSRLNTGNLDDVMSEASSGITGQ